MTVGYGSPDHPKVVVDHVSFHVAEGEILGLVGESGSGKSQTTFAIMGLLPTGGRILSGSIRFRGRELTGLSPGEYRKVRGKEIAYIPQEPMSNLDPTFTVGFQLVEPMRTVLGLSKRQARQRALELLEMVGIPDPQRTFRSYPHQISGGMAQRVLIAGAVSCDPVLLIADEPTTALDVTVQADILDLLRRLQAEIGMAVILVTHDFGVVADICDRVAVMQSGKPRRGEPRPRPLRRTTTSVHPDAPRLDHGRRRTARTTRADRRWVMTEPLLVADEVVVDFPTKGFRKPPFRALHDVSIEIAEHETLGLVGESGSGKSTLGRAILGLAPVTGGAIRFDGRDITHASRAERRKLGSSIQVIFQDPYSSLNPTMTVGDILTEPLTAQGQGRKQANTRVRELLDEVKMPSDAARRTPREFSGGQRQRIAIARALALVASAHHLRRAHLGARPLDAGHGARPAHRDPAGHRRGLPVHLPRPRRRPPHLPPRRRHAARRDRRDR